MADLELGVNPTNLRWRAPTENTDGTPISSPLTYNLYRGSDEFDLEMQNQPYVSLPGTLNPDGMYEAPIEGFVEGRHVIALTAVDSQGDESEFSNSAGFRIGVAPLPPTIFD